MARREKPFKNGVRLEETILARVTIEQRNALERMADVENVSPGGLIRRLIMAAWEKRRTQVLAIERARNQAGQE